VDLISLLFSSSALHIPDSQSPSPKRKAEGEKKGEEGKGERGGGIRKGEGGGK